MPRWTGNQRNSKNCTPNWHKNIGEASELENRGKEPVQEKEDPRPLTDEEFKEYQEKDARSTKKVLRFFKAIWEAINFFS